MDAAEHRRLAQQNQDYAARRAAEARLWQQREGAYREEMHRLREEQHREVVENVAFYTARNLLKEAARDLQDSASKGRTVALVETKREESKSSYGEGTRMAVNAVAEVLREKGYTVEVEENRSSEIKGASHGSYWSKGYEVPTSQYNLVISSESSGT